eukprot:354470-Chlamydomonas_euryale.AAC.24
MSRSAKKAILMRHVHVAGVMLCHGNQRAAARYIPVVPHTTLDGSNELCSQQVWSKYMLTSTSSAHQLLADAPQAWWEKLLAISTNHSRASAGMPSVTYEEA